MFSSTARDPSLFDMSRPGDLPKGFSLPGMHVGDAPETSKTFPLGQHGITLAINGAYIFFLASLTLTSLLLGN